MAARRHLPVLNNEKPSSSGGSEEDDRPGWHWIGFGAVAIFAAWLPLAYVAQVLVARVLPRLVSTSSSSSIEDVASSLATLSSAERVRLTILLGLPHALAFAMASFAGGWLVGRFAVRAGPREAAFSGASAAFVAVVLAWGGWNVVYLVTASIVTGLALVFAGWGGYVGSKRNASRAKK